MDTKGNQTTIVSTITAVPPIEESFVYIAVHGSLYANDCSAFGLGDEEIIALSKKYPGTGTDVVNGIAIKTNVLDAINALSQLGYKVVTSTGESEITWTMQRDA